MTSSCLASSSNASSLSALPISYKNTFDSQHSDFLPPKFDFGSQQGLYTQPAPEFFYEEIFSVNSDTSEEAPFISIPLATPERSFMTSQTSNPATVNHSLHVADSNSDHNNNRSMREGQAFGYDWTTSSASCSNQLTGLDSIINMTAVSTLHRPRNELSPDDQSPSPRCHLNEESNASLIMSGTSYDQFHQPYTSASNIENSFNENTSKLVTSDQQSSTAHFCPSFMYGSSKKFVGDSSEPFDSRYQSFAEQTRSGINFHNKTEFLKKSGDREMTKSYPSNEMGSLYASSIEPDGTLMPYRCTALPSDKKINFGCKPKFEDSSQMFFSSSTPFDNCSQDFIGVSTSSATSSMTSKSPNKSERFTPLLHQRVQTYLEGSQSRRSPFHKPTDLSVSTSQQAAINFDGFYGNQNITVKSEVPTSFPAPEPNFIEDSFPNEPAMTSQKPNAFSFAPMTSTPVCISEYSTNGQMYFSSMPTPFPPPYKSDRYNPYPSVADGQVALGTAMSLRPSSEGLCAVCGDNAACQHYGVRTCEGCKGFFKRTVQKKSTYVCLANKNCPVDKRRRNRCQFCRFEKCLAVGMVKEVVRTDHLKGRRGRLPSKPKGPKDPVARPCPPVPFITSLVQAHICTNPAIANIDTSRYRPPCMQTSISPFNFADEAAKFYELLQSCVFVTRLWAEKIPGFASLCPDDQATLIESSFFEVFVLRLAIRSEIQEGKLIFCNGLALHHSQLHGMFECWVDPILKFTIMWNELNVDLSSYSCLLAFLLFQDYRGIREVSKVKELQQMVMDNLREFTRTSPLHSDRHNFLNSLLGMICNLHETVVPGVERLRRFHSEVQSVQIPKCLESILKRKMMLQPR